MPDPAQVSTRAFVADDYDRVVALWQQSEGVEVAEGDDRATILGYLERNPRLSRVALVGETIIGGVLCGHDGRRGYLYHLAVAREHRGQGLGRRLVDECLAGLRARGIQRALILVVKDNNGGRAFWVSRGFEELSGAVAMGVDLP